MLLMVFVNDLWSVGGVPHSLEHFEVFEDGMGVADIVFPMFLFAMGMSIPYGALSGVLGLLKCVVFPLSQQMEFNSRLLKLNDDADIMEELKGLTPEQIKALIALVKKS